MFHREGTERSSEGKSQERCPRCGHGAADRSHLRLLDYVMTREFSLLPDGSPVRNSSSSHPCTPPRLRISISGCCSRLASPNLSVGKLFLQELRGAGGRAATTAHSRWESRSSVTAGGAVTPNIQSSPSGLVQKGSVLFLKRTSLVADRTELNNDVSSSTLISRTRRTLPPSKQMEVGISSAST